MQKKSPQQKEVATFNDLSGNLTKLAEQVELQLRLLSLFPNTRKHAKVGFFGAQGDQPVAKKFLLVIYLKEDMLNTIVCTTAAFCCQCQTFLQPIT